MEKFGWAYLGTGGIANTTAGELLKAGEGYIAACWNRTREKAEKFAETYCGTVYDTPEEAILDPNVEGVYIALTANLHADFLRRCIELGKPVLCEKPFTVNAAQAEAVFAFARERGVYAAEAMWTWHNAVARQVRYWVQSGAVGKIKRVYCTYSFPMLKSPYKKPRHTSPELIGGALLDTGVYGLRYCYELFGMPQAIHCEGRVEGGIDLGETVTLDYGEFQADFLFSRDQNHGETFEITGDLGSISVPMYHCARKAKLTGIQSGKIKDKNSLFGEMFRHTAQEIRSGDPEPKIITQQSTIDVMQIMDECRRQMGLKYPCEE